MNTAQQPEALRFTKKPVVIEAFQMTEERRASNADWPEWMHQAWQLDREAPGSLYPTEEGTGDGTLSIGTLEGQHLVSWGDWIIRGVKGELYPCKPGIFEATYTSETKPEAQLSAIGAGGVEPLRKRAAPQGWKLVPVEPTEKMIIEGGCAQTLKDGHRYIGECTAKTAWSFMLAAAPTPPEAFETEGGLVCENSTSKQGAQASVSNMTSAAPVQMPEPFTTLVRKKSWPTNCYEASPLYNHRDYGRLWADERVNVYTEQQVRALLAAQAKQGGAA